MNEPATGTAVYSGVEHGTIDVPIEHVLIDGQPRVFPEISGRGYFKMYLKDNRLVFQAGGHVGIIPINERLSIEVRPRVPVASIERMLNISGFLPVEISGFQRNYQASEIYLPCLHDHFSRALLRAIEPIIDHGKYRPYIRHQEATSFPKGRLLFEKTLARYAARGMSHRVECGIYRKSSQNRTNAYLRKAIQSLLSDYGMINAKGPQLSIISQLNVADHHFRDVEIYPAHDDMDFPEEISRFDHRKDYYEPAIRVAFAILNHQGFSFSGSDGLIRSTSLIVNMADVFEGYIRTALNGLSVNNVDFAVLDGNKKGGEGGERRLFSCGTKDLGREIPARPDIVIARRVRSTPILVADAKYKPVKGNPDREDINQIATYAMCYGSKIAVIISPKIDSASAEMSKIGDIGDVQFYTYRFDLFAKDLLAEEKKLCDTIRGILPVAPARN